jgi:hypothetical protein
VRVAAASVLVAAAAIAGGACGSGSNAPASPPGPLADALASVGGGGANGSLGFGWAEPDLAASFGASAPKLVADALGPNADTVVEAAGRFRRRYGLDPLAADRLVSVGGSYEFGLRLDGLDGSALSKALVAEGARSRAAANAQLLDIGGYASVPDTLLALDVNGLGARDAFAPDSVILAISDTARAALLGRGETLLDEPTYAAAADCLGKVVAARMVPAKLLLSTELGVSAVAMGVGQSGETLCVLGGTPARANEVAAALERGLAAGARDPRTGERIGGSIAGVEVSTDTYDGIQMVRAELTPAAGTPPGWIFAAASRGSLVGLIDPG